jgi:hypothetical protein
MLLGILSVTFATSQQQQVGILNNPLAIRLWLSRGKTGNDRYTPPFDTLPLESSVSASKIIAIPRHLLNLSVFLFIVGFGLYLLFSWLNHVSTPPSNYRNIFVTFMVTVGVSGLYYIIWNMLRLYDDLRVTNQFDLRKLGGFPKGSPLHQLRDDLYEMQNKLEEREIMVFNRISRFNNVEGEEEEEGDIGDVVDEVYEEKVRMKMAETQR